MSNNSKFTSKDLDAVTMKEQSRKKKNQMIRNVLLVATIILFGFLILVFFSSYWRYVNIRERIESIYQAINKDSDDYSDILATYNEAENHFRSFSVDFDKKSYNSYTSKLSEIEERVESLINKTNQIDSLDHTYPVHLLSHKALVNDFILLKIKIGSLLEQSKELQQFPQLLIDKNISTLPPTRTFNSISSDSTQVNEKVYVREKRSLLKRIFDNKNDTIRIDEIERVKKERDEIIEQLSQEIDVSYVNAQNQLKDVKESFEALRLKERELLANNVKLLREINDMIRNLQNHRIIMRQQATNNEVQSLIAQTNSFKWQMILSLSFMLIMIFIIVYYQFFASYYERKLVEEKLYASRLAQEKTDVLAEITHEIRTPINSLIGILDILRKKSIFDNHDKLFLESSFSHLRSTSKTINDILNLSRIDETRTINIQSINIRELVTDILDTYSNQAQLKGIELCFDSTGDTPDIIYSDEFKIRQILTNLISNAIKYSHKGIVRFEMNMPNADVFNIKVQDQGIGMSQKVRENIFKKYYTASDTGKTSGGVGLGLYITKKIIESLNGKITFESEPDQGTIFFVEIPIKESNLKIQDKKEIHQITDLPNNLKLLIVDDNPLNLLYMRQLFNKHKNVLVATDGKEALETIRNQDIDLIITDINMPIMRGDELFLEIRKNSSFNHIKVIATSSDNEQVTSIEQKSNIKFNGVLIKPFDEKTIAQTIFSILYMEN